jgi:hypothetical protein
VFQAVTAQYGKNHQTIQGNASQRESNITPARPMGEYFSALFEKKFMKCSVYIRAAMSLSTFRRMVSNWPRRSIALPKDAVSSLTARGLICKR